MAELRCSHLELNRAVLSRQYLIDRLPAGTGAAAAVSAIGALQSQYNPSPFLALHARVEGFTADELRAALDSHQVVKASLMRGTLHVVSAADYPMYASVVDGPVTRLWNTWLGKFLDVVPMQAALLDLSDPGPCTRQQVVEFCAAWATEHFPPEAVWPPVGSWFFPPLLSVAAADPADDPVGLPQAGLLPRRAGGATGVGAATDRGGPGRRRARLSPPVRAGRWSTSPMPRGPPVTWRCRSGCCPSSTA